MIGIRKRGNTYQCCFEAGKVNGKRKQITKCGFKPNNEANPYIGENNKLEFVEEEKLEVVCDVNNVKKSFQNYAKFIHTKNLQ